MVVWRWPSRYWLVFCRVLAFLRIPHGAKHTLTSISVSSMSVNLTGNPLHFCREAVNIGLKMTPPDSEKQKTTAWIRVKSQKPNRSTVATHCRQNANYQEMKKGKSKTTLDPNRSLEMSHAGYFRSSFTVMCQTREADIRRRRPFITENEPYAGCRWRAASRRVARRPPRCRWITCDSVFFFSPQLALCHRRVWTTAAPQIDARLTGRTRCGVPERAGPLLTAALLMQRCRALSIRSIIGSPDGFAQDGGGGVGGEGRSRR